MQQNGGTIYAVWPGWHDNCITRPWHGNCCVFKIKTGIVKIKFPNSGMVIATFSHYAIGFALCGIEMGIVPFAISHFAKSLAFCKLKWELSRFLAFCN